MDVKFKIENVSEYIFSLKINHEEDEINKIMYQMLNNIIKNSFYNENSIFFTAESVKDLKSFIFEYKNNILPEKKCIKMIDDLSKQIIYLRKNNYSFSGFEINDIIVIDNNNFIICNTEFLFPLIEDNIIFYLPIKKPYFFNPEIIKIDELPSEINYKCSYYSLGVLIIFCLTNKYILKANSEEEIEAEFEFIKDTKMYWFLKRCLNTNTEKRELLLI
jgi:hypothetical protein